jgi:hypothetical protein
VQPTSHRTRPEAEVLSTIQTEILIGIVGALLIGSFSLARIHPRILTVLFMAPLWVTWLSILALILAVATDFVWDGRDGRAFDKISTTDTEGTILQKFGHPDTIEPCGENLYWGYDSNYMGKNDGRCVKWVRYNHFLSVWAVGYSGDGRIVSKYHYFSE